MSSTWDGRTKTWRAPAEKERIDAAAAKLAAWIPGRFAVLVGVGHPDLSPYGPPVRLVRPDCPVPEGFVKVAWPPAMPPESNLSVELRLAPENERMCGPPTVPGVRFVVDGIAFAAWGATYPDERTVLVRVFGADPLGAEWIVLSRTDPPVWDPVQDPPGMPTDIEAGLAPWAIGTVVVG